MGELTRVHLDRWRTRLQLIVRSDRDVAPAPLLTVLTTQTNRLELLASRFREDSVVSSVNRSAGSPVDVPWDFVRVLTAALDAAAATNGLVSPLLGLQVDGAGYRSWRDTRPIRPKSTPVADWRSIEVVPTGSSASVQIPAGSALDLGAVAKAWLADRLAGLVCKHLGVDVIADMGGDLRVQTSEDPWLVAVDPGTGSREVQHLSVGCGGLATSGTTTRSWRYENRSIGHHLIDPRTARPVDSPWTRASVWAGGATAANTASTAAIVLGPAAPAWLERLGLSAVLSGAGGCLRVGQWPADDLDVVGPDCDVESVVA